MRIKKIRTKLLLGTVPFILLSMAILTWISGTSSRKIITEQITDRMEAELASNINEINSDLHVIKNTAMNLSRVVGGTYKSTKIEDYESAFKEII